MVDDPPILPFEWLSFAAGIARTMSYGSARYAPSGQHGLVTRRTGEAMRKLEVEPPDGWQEALARQCGWTVDA